MYTSGTTGEPKGVIIKNEAFMSEVLSIDQIIMLTYRVKNVSLVKLFASLKLTSVVTRQDLLIVVTLQHTTLYDRYMINNLYSDYNLVSIYQHEETKRTIIRLEQGVHSFTQKSMASHGALAMLYGCHSNYYIKKPEYNTHVTFYNNFTMVKKLACITDTSSHIFCYVKQQRSVMRLLTSMVQEEAQNGQVELEKHVITKTLTKPSEAYYDAKNLPHVLKTLNGMKKAASHKTTIPSASSMTLTPSLILFELLLLSPMTPTIPAVTSKKTFPLQRFLQCQLKTGVIAWVSLLGLVVNVVLSWLLVYVWDFGLIGAAIALDVSWWVLVIGMFGYTVCGGCPLTWNGFSMEAFSGLWEFFKLSLASGVMLCLENWYYRILLLMTVHDNPATTKKDRTHEVYQHDSNLCRWIIWPAALQRDLTSAVYAMWRETVCVVVVWIIRRWLMQRGSLCLRRCGYDPTRAPLWLVTVTSYARWLVGGDIMYGVDSNLYVSVSRLYELMCKKWKIVKKLVNENRKLHQRAPSENWYYRILLLMTGQLENATIAVDALSYWNWFCSMTINELELIPFAFFAGTGVRVANELGAGKWKSAKFAMQVSLVQST
ncbi:hypothetical protein RYX36_023716, partial [Vicia faba]